MKGDCQMRNIDNECIESISKILGEMTTGSKITQILAKHNWIDHDTLAGQSLISTKWKRINASITDEVKKANSLTPFFKMIEEIMNPLNFLNQEDVWTQNRKNINFSLSFSGYELTDGGKIKSGKAAKTFTEAVERTKSLLEKLEIHNIHPDVLKFCKPELLDKNYFHAVLEASKSVLDKIRNLTFSSKDGNTLVNEAFVVKNPALIIRGNFLKTDDERSEYNGLKSLLNTICYFYRNPQAHSPKLYNPISEMDAITAFIMMSLAHEQLDRCQCVRQIP
jgi:uncharacterized protein (TIGR02391 family)